MKTEWSLLLKELLYHGVDIDGDSFKISGKKVNPKKYTFIIKSRINENKKILSEITDELVAFLNSEKDGLKTAIDSRIKSVFIESVKDLDLIFQIYIDGFLCKNKEVIFLINNIKNSDINSYSKEFCVNFINYKLSIIHILKTIFELCYVRRLIDLYFKGEHWVDKFVKTARGAGGPFVNLDLPMKERYYAWSEIEEDVKERTRELQTQQRYKGGLDNYNDTKFQPGHFYNDYRNQAYSWYKRKEEGIYPGRWSLY